MEVLKRQDKDGVKMRLTKYNPPSHHYHEKYKFIYWSIQCTTTKNMKGEVGEESAANRWIMVVGLVADVYPVCASERTFRCPLDNLCLVCLLPWNKSSENQT